MMDWNFSTNSILSKRRILGQDEQRKFVEGVYDNSGDNCTDENTKKDVREIEMVAEDPLKWDLEEDREERSCSRGRGHTSLRNEVFACQCGQCELAQSDKEAADLQDMEFECNDDSEGSEWEQ